MPFRLGLRLAAVAVLILAALLGTKGPQSAVAQADCQTFTETGKTVCGKFLQYWQTHGALVQQGFPITEVLGEISAVDGKLYTVQYFERAVFELHPENPPPYDVLLSLLGSLLYDRKYPQGAPGQSPNVAPDARIFNETGKRLGGGFLQYWLAHGGLAQQGLPISEEFNEVSDLNGQTYRVQYFERAVFEFHAENPPASSILLSQLGTFRYRELMSQGYAWQPPPVPVSSGNTQTPPTPVAAGSTSPPSDTAGFARYIMSKYNRINNIPFTFEDVFTDDSTETLGHYITLELDANGRSALKAAGRATVQQWGDAINAEARATWPKDNYYIQIGWSTYSDDPCFDCNDECYYQSEDYTSRRGWYTVFTYVLITQSRGALVCQYIT